MFRSSSEDSDSDSEPELNANTRPDGGVGRLQRERTNAGGAAGANGRQGGARGERRGRGGRARAEEGGGGLPLNGRVSEEDEDVGGEGDACGVNKKACRTARRGSTGDLPDRLRTRAGRGHRFASGDASLETHSVCILNCDALLIEIK